jgi:DNA-binding GntR family transcriptional regulator
MISSPNQDPFIDDDRSIAGIVARALGERIIAGELPPGSALRQDHIASEFRTSHVPVREAFRRLEAQGLAVSEPRRGVRVSPLDTGAIMEITEMRAALEALALRFAIPRMTASDLKAARNAMEADRATSSHDVMMLEAINRHFHDAITRPCAMPTLIATLEQLRFSSARIMVAMWKELSSWQERSNQEHQAILDAIEQRDAGTAVERLKSHILGGGAALAERLVNGANVVHPE